MDLPQGTLKELSRRLNRPRVVLWLGSRMILPEGFLEDLSRLPLVAVYSEATSDEFERALTGLERTETRYIVAVTEEETIPALSSAHLPLFYLQGGPGQRIPKAQRQGLRAQMTARLKEIAAERPVYLSLGLNADHDEGFSLLEAVDGYDPTAPILLLDVDPNLPRTLSSYAEAEELLTRPAASFQSWGELKEWLGGVGLSLVGAQTRPQILVGSQRVALDHVFADPLLQIDDRVRFITTRALSAPPKRDLGRLFDAFMQPDERRDAPTAAEDVDEWWAIAEGVPIERPSLAERINLIGAALRELRRSPLEHGRICWLPAEGGSGLTSMLHQIAFAVAAEGYPTLVVKQLTRALDKDALANVLAEINRLAGVAGEERETPTLLVLDSVHASSNELAELPDYLARVSRRQVMTLWGVQVPFGEAVPRAGRQLLGWYRRRFKGFVERVPHKSDLFLAPLVAGIEEREISLLEAKSAGLRRHGLDRIREHTLETWREFQSRQRFSYRDFLRQIDRDDRSVDAWLRAEELLWPAVYHFLTEGRKDPFVRFEGILRVVLDKGGRLGLGMLLEVAKTSNWGIVVPLAALQDWVQSKGLAPQPSPSPADHSTEPTDGNPDVQEMVRRLQEWAQTRPIRSDPAERSAQFTSEILDLLSDLGVVRTLPVNGHVWARMSHRAEARGLLLVALGRLEAELKQLGFWECLGGAEAVFDQNHAYRGLQDLVGSLKLTPHGLRFCELLSHGLLFGPDDWKGWHSGEGEQRLQVYENIPCLLRNESRALLHHHAGVLRRSTFFNALTMAEKRTRLERASTLIDKALGLPWRTGVWDEHPAHLYTTLGLVLRRLSECADVKQDRFDLSRQARDHLELALAEIPESRHARLALAQLLLEQAADSKALRDTDRKAEAVGMVARILELLSVTPTGKETRWYEIKHAAAKLFDDEAGRRLIQDLKRRGVEDGFLLEAELALDRGEASRAIDSLAPLVRDALAATHRRAARRLAAIYAETAGYETRYGERYRLLHVVELSGARLTPEEEFQLAWLEYQKGDYDAGRRRFAVLRNTSRDHAVPPQEHLFLCTADGEPRQFQGRVNSIEAERGWFAVQDPSDHRRLFDAPFLARHFSGLRQGSVTPIVVRFHPRGPGAVPTRFARRR